MKAATSALYAAFILADNISVLSRLRFVNVISEEAALAFANVLWLASLLSSIVSISSKLLRLSIVEEELVKMPDLSEKAYAKQLSYIQRSKGEQLELGRDSKTSRMIKHNRSKVKHSLELCKNFSDLILGLHFTGLTKRYLKHDFGESLLGIAGATSSFLGLY